MREKRERERSGERDSFHVLGDGESPLGDDTGENHQSSSSFAVDQKEVCLLRSSRR